MIRKKHKEEPVMIKAHIIHGGITVLLFFLFFIELASGGRIVESIVTASAIFGGFYYIGAHIFYSYRLYTNDGLLSIISMHLYTMLSVLIASSALFFLSFFTLIRLGTYNIEDAITLTTLITILSLTLYEILVVMKIKQDVEALLIHGKGDRDQNSFHVILAVFYVLLSAVAVYAVLSGNTIVIG